MTDKQPTARHITQIGGINHMCDRCSAEADWRARDRAGNVVAAACKAHKHDVRREALRVAAAAANRPSCKQCGGAGAFVAASDTVECDACEGTGYML